MNDALARKAAELAALDEAQLPAPRLDEAALHGVLGDAVRAIRATTEAHDAGVLASLMCGIGALIGRAPYVDLEQRHGVNLFAVLVGPTGHGRKGTATHASRRLIRDLDPDFERTRVLGGLSSGEGLIDFLAPPPAKRSRGEEEVEMSPAPADSRLWLIETEFGAVLSRRKREGNTMSPVLRQAFDGDDLRVLTVRTEGRVALSPHISLLAHITGAELRRHYDELDSASGFFNRFLFVHVAKTKDLPFPPKMDPKVRAQLLTRLSRGVDFARRQAEVPLAASARDTYVGMYTELSDADIGELAARAPVHVLRMALLFAVLDMRAEIDAPHLVAAKAFWDYADASARRAFGIGPLASALPRKLLAALRQAGPAGLSREAIRDSVVRSNNVTAERITLALVTLAEAGLITMNMVMTAGRSAEVWAVTPQGAGLSSHSSHGSGADPATPPRLRSHSSQGARPEAA